MVDSIQSKYNEYCTKYPLYKHDAIINLMVEDGVITLDIAKKIKSGVSLFLLDNQFQKSETTTNINMKSIMGASFSATAQKAPPKTNFNSQIEPTKQSIKQVDCWLLSDINAMNQTKWGKQAIKDALVPDEDGSGGIMVKFKGSPLAQKNFHITAEEIQKAKKSGHYSSGDDDMMAFELATEKLSMKLVEEKKGERLTSFDEVIGHKSYLTNITTDKKHNKYLDISTLITGREDVEMDFLLGAKGSNNILKYISQNFDKTSTVCCFNHYKDIFCTRAENDPVHGNHAYAIKKIDYGKSVTIIDPFHTDKEIKLSWDKFINDVEQVSVASKDDKTKHELEQTLPKDYAEIRQKDLDKRQKALAKNEQEYQTAINKINQEKADREVKDILSGLQYLDQEIESNSKKTFTPNLYIYYDEIKNAMNNVNKDNVTTFLNKQPDIITKLDKYKSGIGNGEDKKALILPIIKALTAKAQDHHINANTINNFITTCTKELDATFYTNADVISSEVNKMKALVEK